MKNLKFLLLFLFLLTFLIPFSAQAFSTENSLYQENNFILEEGEVIEKNLWKAANNIEVNGIVKGDVFLMAGEDVTINGEIQGDVISFSHNLYINGIVEGNIRSLASNNLTISGTIEKNVLAISKEKFQIENQGLIGQDVNIFSKNTQIQGPINRNLTAQTETLIINNQINGSANIILLDENGSIDLENEALIKKDFTYKYVENLNFNQDRIVGQLTWEEVEEAKEFSFVKFLIKVFALIIVGLVFVNLFKKHLQKLGELNYKTWHIRTLKGFVIIILSPILIFLLLFTVIGLPLALIWAALFTIALFTFQLIASLAIGNEAIKLVKKTYKQRNFNAEIVIGIIILNLLYYIPILGFLIYLLATFWSFGKLYNYCLKK